MKNLYKMALWAILLMGIGVAIWKHLSKPLPLVENFSEEPERVSSSSAAKSTLPELNVGGQIITPDDLQWEIDLHTLAPKFSAESPTDKSEKVEVSDDNRSELRDRIISSVLERKISYLYITEKLKGFNSDDPARFTKCLAMVGEISKENPEFFASRKSHDRLKNKLCEQSVIEQYLDERVLNSVTVSPSEVASYYRTHEKEFKKPLRITLRQIVVATAQEAQTLRKEVKTSNFSELAQKHSMTPEAKKGGLLGPFSKEQLPTLFDIVFSMNVGEISGVIKSEFGYHIIMPIERHPAQTLSLAEASPQIQAEFQRSKRLEIYQKWLGTAMNAVSVITTPSGI